MFTSNLVLGFLLLLFFQLIAGDYDAEVPILIGTPITEKNTEHILISLPVDNIIRVPSRNAVNTNNIYKLLSFNPFGHIVPPIPRRQVFPAVSNPLDGLELQNITTHIPLVLNTTESDTNSECIDLSNKSNEHINKVLKKYLYGQTAPKHDNSVISPDINDNLDIKDNASRKNKLSTKKIISEHYKLDSIPLNKDFEENLDHSENNASVENEMKVQKDGNVNKYPIDVENKGFKSKIIDTGPAVANFVSDTTLNFFGQSKCSRDEDLGSRDTDKLNKIIINCPKLIYSELKTAKEDDVLKEKIDCNKDDIISMVFPQELIVGPQFFDGRFVKPFYEVEIPNNEAFNEYENALKYNLALQALKNYQIQQSDINPENNQFNILS